MEQLGAQQDDFTSVLGLAETLALSRDPQVKGFVKILYTTLFKWYADESHRLRMLKRLVDRATTTADTSRDIDSDLEILAILVCEDQEIVRPVLSMMRRLVAELANVDRAALWHQLCASEDEILRIREERKAEIASTSKEKAVLSQKLSEYEATNSRLKSAEAARRRFDEELKRFATENVTREEIRQSLEDEVRRLTQTVGQTEGEKREKEEQVARCEAYIDGMESKLQACEQYIHHLEAQFQEEMARHAPLYGVGLDALSMKELETLSRIHEEGLRQIRAIQQRKGSPAGSPLVSPHTLSHTHGLYPRTPPPMPVGLPPSLIPNGVGIHSNGHVNGGIGPWFNH
ncbi:UNVERIFIED_CONTAM: hypothetical protein Sangu_1819200 [Sesamum angustifolium]|uniref:FRIGIDA-like protein n=1 Tax=Sesamum angustifolium TaxID=2727405 RepID=A0AAW2M891_9LAMI